MEKLLEPENILDATTLHPSVKHATIFNRFDELQPGESLILHNDHDPMPLRFQLENTRGNIFQWEYLEKGPELFRIKITKNKLPQEEKKEVKTEKGNILNVPEIEPKLKHPTIFVRFDELKPGESLTIHNDHDPKPLYYELSAERGDIFTWEYLEKGPELWKVKITKNKATQKGKENILDATLLHSGVKHATIFKTFECL